MIFGGGHRDHDLLGGAELNEFISPVDQRLYRFLWPTCSQTIKMKNTFPSQLRNQPEKVFIIFYFPSLIHECT